MELPAVSLKTIVLVHWVLTTWACMYNWLPSAYAWSNFTVLAMGIWAMAQKDSIDAVSTFLIGLLFSILSDVLICALYYTPAEKLTQDRPERDLFRFSAGMVILSLILKPLSCFFLYHMYRERGGDYNISLDFSTGNRDRDRSAYQSIDRQEDSSTYQSIDQQNAPTKQVNKMAPSLY